MNWNLFYITFGIAFFLSAPMFRVLNDLGMERGQVPTAKHVHWKGRRFSNWKEETTLYVGNPFFFSLMDALIVSSFVRIEWTVARIIWASFSILAGLGITISWFVNATRAYNNGNIPSWGWQWCGPKKISIVGYYHTVYFLIQSIAMASVVIFFAWQDSISIHIKIGMLFSMTGYASTFFHFTHMQERLQSLYNDSAGPSRRNQNNS